MSGTVELFVVPTSRSVPGPVTAKAVPLELTLRFMVAAEKFAVFPAPSAITAPLQFAAFVQLPLPGLVHVPLAAFTGNGKAQSQTNDKARRNGLFLIEQISRPVRQ